MPKPSQLRHITVRLRVSVDTAVWNAASSKELPDKVKDYCVDRLRESPLIVAVRRDGS